MFGNRRVQPSKLKAEI